MGKVAVILSFLVIVYTVSSQPAFLSRSFRRNANDQVSNPSNFMDPSFSVGSLTGSQTQDQSVMQQMALRIVQSQGQGRRASGPPLGSSTDNQIFQTQGGSNANFQTQDQKQPGVPAQSATLTNGSPPRDTLSRAPLNQTPGGQGSNQPKGPVFTQTVVETSKDTGRGNNNPSTSNVISRNDDNSSIYNNGAAGTSNGIQQTVSNTNMFNPGNMNSLFGAPPGTGDSQFNNNMGSKNSMTNKFGGGGLSIDATQFFQPRQNPDGSISGAAGNSNGPPTMGPGLLFNMGGSSSNNNNNNNNNNYNSMFGPPNFFMNPGASFGTK